ncbi:MAG: zinc ribbon domain-containing protein [Anaerolineaceae bacterium]|nr:zinc ribbon domain-containing protein [Anaerolineaceae bacterium]
MARKVLGYIELVWTCDSCGTRNPGAIRSCTSCGAPQPVDVKFERVDPNTFNFIKDEALIRMAQAGPDKHCPYCGTRNLADAEICVNCGGDLTVGATSRPAGAALEAEPIQPQPAGPPQTVARKPLPKWALIVIVLVLLSCCVFGAMYFSRARQTDTMNATVAEAYWRRQVAVETYQMVRASDWKNEIPFTAQPYDCQLRYRYDSETPKPNSEEVCGEPYTIDTGTGVGEVVQDCYYRVSEEYCSYDTMEWVVVNTLVDDGYGTNAIWPSTNLTTDQRFGDSTEQYTITFTAENDEYQYTFSDYDLFLQAVPGSNWVIEVNKLGNITSVSPD